MLTTCCYFILYGPDDGIIHTANVLLGPVGFMVVCKLCIAILRRLSYCKDTNEGIVLHGLTHTHPLHPHAHTPNRFNSPRYVKNALRNVRK